jgi:hypothetical protein
VALEASQSVSALTTADRGCLVLADISGCTTYLMSTELEHAHDIVADLVQTIRGDLEPVLQVSRRTGSSK